MVAESVAGPVPSLPDAAASSAAAHPWRLILAIALPCWIMAAALRIVAFQLQSWGAAPPGIILVPTGARVIQHVVVIALALLAYRGALALGWPEDARWRAAALLGHLVLAAGVAVAARPALIYAAQLLGGPTPATTPGLANFSGYGLKLWIATSLDFAVTYAFGLALLFGVRASLALRDSRLARAALENAWTRARLQSLRMQLNPHFLCNALNTVATLLDRDPRRARSLVVTLGDLFRRTLAAGEEEWTSVAAEAAYVREHLEVHAARFGDRFSYEIAVADDVGGVPLPSLLLQPLVENATTHGVDDDRDALRVWLHVARAGEGELRIEIGNRSTGRLSSARRRPGLGLVNTQARLAACYGERSRLTRSQPDIGTFVVAIVVPVPPAWSAAA